MITFLNRGWLEPTCSLANDAGRDRTARERHPRAAGSACARGGNSGSLGGPGVEGGETGARDTPFSRDSTPTLASTSTTGAERERRERTNPTNEPTNGRGTKGERGTQAPEDPPLRATNFKRGLRAQFTCPRAVSKERCFRFGDTVPARRVPGRIETPPSCVL